MAIKAIVDSVDTLPDDLREHYRAGTADEGAEGKFVLAVDAVEGFALENVAGLKTTFGKEMTARKNLEKELARFKDIDPDAARTAFTELEELRKLDPAKDADQIVNTKFEALKTQLVNKHTTDITQRDERIKVLGSAVDELVREARATEAIVAAGGSVELLLPHVLKATKTVEKDGKFAVDVVDTSGEVRYADAKGTPLDLKGLVAEMKTNAAFARAFDGEGQTGTGAPHNNGGPGPGRGKVDGDIHERAAHFAAKNGLPVR